MFSSINFGTDTTEEGRLVMHELLNAVEKGLADGETPIFPISILKVKDGITFSQKDYDIAINDLEGAFAGNYQFEAPNFDIFLRACQVSAKRLFPNFIFLDSTFNKHELWNIEDPLKYEKEVSSMGCRTRVFDNINGAKTSIGRGNISFSTINLVRLAIISNKDKELYIKKVRKTSELVAEQLLERFEFQKKAKAKQFPFLVGQNLWKNKGLSQNENVGDELNSGTLSIGFIGLAEALKCLTGYHHAESKESQEFGLRIVKEIRDVCEEYKNKYNLNFSCLATPSEGLSGRFTSIDRKEFGTIDGVTDREYYTNSCHCPVYYNMSALDKISIEAPYHELCNAGHILYVELDGSPKDNLKPYIKIVKQMHDKNVGYGAINHPVDRCLNCSYEGSFNDDKCPLCGSSEINKIRRITGYLVGGMDRWNSYKKAEERDRIKHS